MMRRVCSFILFLAFSFLAGCATGSGDGKHLSDELAYRFFPVEIPNSPPARFDHTMTVDPVGKRVFMFGGRGEDGFLGDLWLLDAKKRRWRRIDVETGPSPRSGHSLTWDSASGRLILFGGYRSDKYGQTHFLRELWLYSREEGFSREFFSVGPCGRAWHSTTLMDGRLIIFGGFTGGPGYHLNDVWSLDLADLGFKRILSDGGPKMAGRALILPAGEPRSMMIVGRDGIYEPELVGRWLVHLDSDEWITTPGADDPDPRYNISGANPRDGTVFVIKTTIEDDRSFEHSFWMTRGMSQIWLEQAMEYGPKTVHGMACVPHPIRPFSWICNGGVLDGEISSRTWLLAPCPEEGCEP